MQEAIVLHQNWRGLYAFSTDTSGEQTTCTPDPAECGDRIRWPGGNALTFLQNAVRDTMTWYGSLIMDQQDATGLSYRRNRYYDPVSGQFTQTDPIGIAGGLNLYGYAGGDPINFSDPFGLDPCEDFIDDEEKYAECEEGAKPFKQVGRDVADAAVNPGYAAAGFGDLLTLGGTKYVREQLLDCADCVDYDSGAYRAGQVAGAAAVIVEGGLLAARLAGWTSKVAIHGAHHTFGSLGRLSHIQVNIWQKGVKGSGRALLRIPLPWR